MKSHYFLSILLITILIGCSDAPSTSQKPQSKVDRPLDVKKEVRAGPKLDLNIQLSEQDIAQMGVEKNEADILSEPSTEIEDPILEKDKGVLDKIKKVQVGMDQDGTPIVGYRFKDKSEAAKKAEQRYMSDLPANDPLREQSEVSGQIVDGKIE